MKKLFILILFLVPIAINARKNEKFIFAHSVENSTDECEDDFLVDFSMELARDGAWQFAKNLSSSLKEDAETLIISRDIKVAQKASIITKPGKIVNLILKIIRFGEKGTVSDRINTLK